MKTLALRIYLAVVAVLLVFALVDPSSLDWSGHPLNLSRRGVYTAAFFLFWIISMAACWLSTTVKRQSILPGT